MPEPITRDGIIEALREMPADATIDDAIERLVFLARVEAGLAELDAGEGCASRRRQTPTAAVKRLVWSPRSLQDLLAIHDYIARIRLIAI